MPFCNQCGSELEEPYCTSCGTKCAFIAATLPASSVEAQSSASAQHDNESARLTAWYRPTAAATRPRSWRSYYVAALQKYAVFSGRATRSEYWFFVLFAELVFPLIFFALIVAYEFVAIFSGVPEKTAVDLAQDGWAVLFSIWFLVMLLPTIAVSVRRLHDIGYSGWFLLINFVPIIGGIILLVFYCTDSKPGANQYGENPKGMG